MMNRTALTFLLVSSLSVGAGFAATDIPPWIKAPVRPTFANGPTPLNSVSADTGIGETTIVTPPSVTAITFDTALRTYLRGAVSVIAKPNGAIRFIDCVDKVEGRLSGDDAALATAMQERASTELASVLVPMHAKFVTWYRTTFPGAAMTSPEVTALYREYVMARLTTVQAETIRGHVADAVIAAGLTRATDLMVTPVLAARGPVLGETCRCYGQPCICSPGMVCSCQMSNAQGDDCSPPARSCNAEDFPETKLVTVGR